MNNKEEAYQSEIIIGYPITTKSRGDCILQIVSWIEDGVKGKYFVCANPHSIELARNDPKFDSAIKNADLVVPDGMGVVIASRLLGGSIRERVTGSDIFWGVNSELNKKNGHSVFLLGSTEENLAKMKRRMGSDFPNLKVAGAFSPPFKEHFSEEENQMVAEKVNRARPDVLWIGMTAPKQEKWVYENRDKLDVKVLGPVGAVFDFYAGNVKRPPFIYQTLGLEWLPRFIGEPRRLWRRNLVSNPKFLLRVVGYRLTHL